MVIDNIIEICVSIDIAILGIAYPIIIDKISNIGEKYSSEYIPVLFDNEFPQRTINISLNKKEYKISIFKLSLFATLFSFIFIIFKFSPIPNWNNWFINNSADLVVFTLTIILIVLFFTWIGKVALYSGQSKSILTHLIKNYHKSKTDTEIRNYHLKAINELAFYAIEKQDEHLQETLLQFYYTLFANIRKKHEKSAPLVYPIDLYFLIYKLNKIAVENKTKLRAIEHRAVSGLWLLGEHFEDIDISEETYNWLWNNIYIINEDTRLIKMFWENSNQYFQYRIDRVYPNYDFSQNTIINQKDINRREESRNKFLEFHYALGGLMLYRRQYKTLKYMFEFSQSEPPSYVLLPESMTEIFCWFEHFNNGSKHRIPIDLKYSFPELDNLGNRRQVNYWICCYISILFLRQFSLGQYYIYQNFTAQPTLPNEILALSSWLDLTSFFQKCLGDISSDETLIVELGFKKLIEKKANEITSFAPNLVDSIKVKIGQQKLNADLSVEKIQNFNEKSNQIISEVFDIYKPIFIDSTKKHLKGKLKLSINGEKTLMSKSAFTDNDIPLLNYDTVFARSIATNTIKHFIPNSFLVASTKRYLFYNENITLALAKTINRNNDIIIIAINASYQLREILDNSDFKNVIKYIPSTERIQDILFVLRKNDLPAIEHIRMKAEEVKESKLQSINEDLHLYASIIDINKEENKRIKDKWSLENESDNQDLKVELNIAFLSIIHWKDEREIIQISVASEYREQGTQDDLNDIKSLANKNK